MLNRLAIYALALLPVWVFGLAHRPLILELSPDTQKTINFLYEPAQSCERGTWFRLRDES